MQVSGSLAANNSEALRDAALSGLGIALLPDFTAQASLHAGKLVQVLPDWKPVGAFAEHLYAIRPYSAHVPRAVSRVRGLSSARPWRRVSRKAFVPEAVAVATRAPPLVGSNAPIQGFRI